jgi:AcrR family transcriptional regulator
MAATRRKRSSANGDDHNRRDHLVRVSARLFREQGYDATSVRDIAAAAGIQSGSWVYHFPTKQEILAAVMEEGLARSLERIEAIAAKPIKPRAKFRELVRTHLETILAPGEDFIPVLLYDWRSLERASRPKVVALQDRYEALWEQVIDELHRSGDWARPTGIDRLLMFGALNWVAHWYKRKGPLDLEQLTDEAVEFCLRSRPR